MNSFDGVGGDPLLGGVAVYATMSWDPDGAGPISPLLVVAGEFTFAGGVSATRIATWDGISWQPIGAGFDDKVYALGVYQGELIAGGRFSSSGGVPTGHVARWDGSTWQPLGASIPGDVRALTVYAGELIAGGSFTMAAGAPALRVARWNGSSWLPLGTGLGTVSYGSEQVATLAEFGGELFAGGNFNVAGSMTVNAIARWDGIAWNSVGGGAGAAIGPEVRALATYGGELIALGVNGVARWNGTIWQPLGAGLLNGLSLAVYGGDLIAGLGGGPDNIVRWNGSTWLPLGADISNNPGYTSVYALCVWSGELIAGGFFGQPGTHHVARWNGSSWRSLGTGMNFTVEALVSWGPDLVVGGWFTQTLGAPDAAKVARWTGASWAAVGPTPGGSFDGHIHALCDHQGTLVAGGLFSSPANSVAQWNGSAWMPLGPGITGTAGFPEVVFALASWGGMLYAGGAFGTINGNPGSYLLRWNGVSWEGVGGGLNGAVTALHVWGGDLIAGGNFTLAGGVAANHVARFDGTSWHPLGTGLLTGSQVRAMTTMGGDLIVGGHFTSAGGMATPGNIARWDGASWHAVGSSDNTDLYSLAVSNGSLFAGAPIWALPSGVTRGIARFDGATWQPLGTGLYPPSYTATPAARAIADHGGDLFVGGDFLTAGGVVSPYLARWSTPHPSLSLSQPGGPGTGVFITDVGLVPGHEYFNVFSDALCGLPGTGPYLGLCAPDLSFLLFQVTLPVGALPIHFYAPGGTVEFGGYQLPPGLSLDGLCFDWTGGMLGCWSPVTRFQIQ